MRRIYRYLVIVIIAGLFLACLWYFLLHKNGASSQAIPAAGDLKTTIPTTKQVQVPSGSGPVTVNNFLQQHGAVENGYTQFFQNDQFAIGYDGPSGNFKIDTFALTQDQFSQIRAAAEQKFLNLLGVDQTQACALRVQLNNFRADDEAISYKTFPLSFCP